ncbi:MAG: hypothetical protein JHC61_05070 [Burkholderiaceae bacterium]|nr:hypothetical protein [Burkholderiaceae bacterium]
MALPAVVLKLAWKFLSPAVTALALKLGEEGFQALRTMLKTKQSERRAQAQQKAQEAVARAARASTAGEAAALNAQAQVWREVAEQYAQDNKALQAELDVLKAELASRGRQEAQALPALISGGHSQPSPSAPRQQPEPQIRDKQ